MMQIIIAIAAFGLLVWIFKNYSGRFENSAQNAAGWKMPDEKIASPLQEENTQTAQTETEELDYGEINRAYRIADMHFSRGDFGEAERWFIKVLALNENHTEVLNRLGVIYIQHKNPKRAEILYQKLLSVTQKEPAYYSNYGRCLYNQGKFAEAIEAYENAIKLDSSRPARFISIGQIHYEQKDYQKAFAYFLRALDLEPQNLTYLSLVSELAEMVGDSDRLHKCLRKITELDPYNEQAKTKLQNLGNPADGAAVSTQTDLFQSP